MRQVFQPGDQKKFTRIVKKEDCAAFDAGEVHPVYATFALARDAEWCCRLFVLEMKEDDEEGIGAALTIEHLAPAVAGSQVEFVATIKLIVNHTITCSFVAASGGRTIATGTQVQKILKREKLASLFSQSL
ncbi:putative thioesterase [Chitinophaga terrae (ex Kim and Jung 2007)]|jgi:predicted thioesterase|uniref:thioesterase family protein n=1 Tax=Chitinophaga terrae (ex Kim and Jung 2007) TaxID=408074 RepID=UPI00277EEC6F|nr:hypothetical protein [Chitinophaga terrae (ex Kim and Jung 2007)]MDQ0108292.1 putative thioesterase [Chitinophaga terrae (ex Kim and Jung 2007)]